MTDETRNRPTTDTRNRPTTETRTRDTEPTRTSTVDETAPMATMAEFAHTNPYTGQTFGDEMAFERGPAVAADGGRADVRPDGEDNDEAQTMEDVDHEHPHEDAADANRVFARGKGEDETDRQADSV